MCSESFRGNSLFQRTRACPQSLPFNRLLSSIINSLAPGYAPEAIVNMIRALGFHLSTDNIQFLRIQSTSEVKAIFKVEDPLLAKELGVKLKDQKSALSETSVPIDARRTNCRRVYISWHEATRIVCLNFGNGEVANRVAENSMKVDTIVKVSPSNALLEPEALVQKAVLTARTILWLVPSS